MSRRSPLDLSEIFPTDEDFVRARSKVQLSRPGERRPVRGMIVGCAGSFLSAHPRSVPQDKLFSEALTRSLRNGKMAFLSPDAGLRSPRTLRAARTLNARPRASRSRNVPSKNSRLLDKVRLIRNDRDPERERAATLSKIPLLRNVSSLTLRPASVLAYALESNVRSCRLLR